MFFGFSASSDDDETITEIVRGTIAEDENDRTEILSSFFVSFRFCIGTFKVRYRKEGARALGCSSVSRRRAMMMKK